MLVDINIPNRIETYGLTHNLSLQVIANELLISRVKSKPRSKRCRRNSSSTPRSRSRRRRRRHHSHRFATHLKQRTVLVVFFSLSLSFTKPHQTNTQRKVGKWVFLIIRRRNQREKKPTIKGTFNCKKFIFSFLFVFAFPRRLENKCFGLRFQFCFFSHFLDYLCFFFVSRRVAVIKP